MKKKELLLDPILQKNEIDANKTISLASAVAAFVMLFLWVGYLTSFFYSRYPIAVNIIFPIFIVLLLSPLALRKTKYVGYKGYKYFLFGLFLFVVFTVNIILPIYSVISWALIVPISTHYYSKRSAFISFIVTVALMAIAIPFSVLIGQFDSVLFKVSEFQFEHLTRADTGAILNADNVSDRLYFLGHWREYKDVAGITFSRWAAAYGYLFLPRVLVVCVIYIVCHLLAKRTSYLFESERKVASDNEKIRSELDVASSIQKTVLPTSNPTNEIFRVHAIMDPSKEIGGDFYDYFYLDPTHFAIVIGDVSGKSIPGAMFMMKTETLIKTLAPIHKDSDKILSEVNNILNENNSTNMFVTVWLGIFDTKKKTLSFTNAGHNSPIIIQKDSVSFLKDKHNMALGILKDRKYEVGKIKMNKGDKIFLYTDGVTEAHSETNELYGENRLVRLIKSDIANSPRAIISSISSDITKFSGKRQQFDDITMLMLEVLK